MCIGKKKRKHKTENRLKRKTITFYLQNKISTCRTTTTDSTTTYVTFSLDRGNGLGKPCVIFQTPVEAKDLRSGLEKP